MTKILHYSVYLLKKAMFTIITLFSPYRRTDVINVRFVRDEWGLWYVDLPTWKGPKANLLMVGGTELVLDKMLKWERTFGNRDAHAVHVVVSAKEGMVKNCHYFTLDEVCTYDGAFYEHSKGGRVWFCDVLKYVMGEFPETIYYRHDVKKK